MCIKQGVPKPEELNSDEACLNWLKNRKMMVFMNDDVNKQKKKSFRHNVIKELVQRAEEFDNIEKEVDRLWEDEMVKQVMEELEKEKKELDMEYKAYRITQLPKVMNFDCNVEELVEALWINEQRKKHDLQITIMTTSNSLPPSVSASASPSASPPAPSTMVQPTPASVPADSYLIAQFELSEEECATFKVQPFCSVILESEGLRFLYRPLDDKTEVPPCMALWTPAPTSSIFSLAPPPPSLNGCDSSLGKRKRKAKPELVLKSKRAKGLKKGISRHFEAKHGMRKWLQQILEHFDFCTTGDKKELSSRVATILCAKHEGITYSSDDEIDIIRTNWSSCPLDFLLVGVQKFNLSIADDKQEAVNQLTNKLCKDDSDSDEDDEDDD